jgi:dipeptidyl aminopeptidase/acylaminoacyl peptidase
MKKIIPVLILLYSAVLVGAERPMTFRDVLELKQPGSPALSPDGKWLLYTVSTLNWKKNDRFTDIHLVSTDGLIHKQLTFTEDESEMNPLWSPDGSFFVFASIRDDERQLYSMRPDGGEARKITDHEDGVTSFAWNDRVNRLAYIAGGEDQRQLYVSDGKSVEYRKITDHPTGIQDFKWLSNGTSLIFTSPDSIDPGRKLRQEKGFDVQIMNEETFPVNLWAVKPDDDTPRRLTSLDDYSVVSFEISKDDRWIAIIAQSADRYAGVMERDVFLYDIRGGELRRLTENNVMQTSILFSPDNRFLAFISPRNFEYGRNNSIYVYDLQTHEKWLLNTGLDGHHGIGFWSDNGRTIYFTTGIGVNTQLFSADSRSGKLERLSDYRGAGTIVRDERTGMYIIQFSDPEYPSEIFLARSLRELRNRNRWTRLTDTNPAVDGIRLGAYETVRWRSTDGKPVEGILVVPLDRIPGRSHPLIVQIHGGPAAAYMNGFSAGYGTYTHVFTGAGYAVFQPNYRGSSNYGEEFRMEIAGDYFRQAYDDIMTGVDYLIGQGIAHPDSLGMMGWSAGGHWSNWTMTQTDRFKAISTGAGAVNWISLYAQTDVQHTREFYFQGTPYENWEHYVEVSPLRYIRDASTPTLIHFGENDPRIPKPQGDELYMALVKLGVPVEFIVYPSMPHGLTKPKYQYVKMAAEFNWFERWIRGKDIWLDWQSLIE